MNVAADLLETVTNFSVISLWDKSNALIDDMGNRPPFEKRLSERERLAEYRDLRAQPFSMLYRAEEIRQELESYVSDMTPEEREAENVGEDRLRETALAIVLKYDADMKRLAEKLNEPVVGSEFLPPPPPAPIDDIGFGGDIWDSSTTLLPETPLTLGLPPQPPLPPDLGIPPSMSFSPNSDFLSLGP